MEPIFEVRFYATYSMVKENARKYGIGPRIPTMIIVNALMLGVILYCIWLGIIWIMLPYLVLFMAFETVLSFCPHFYACSVLKNSRKQNDDVLPEIVVTADDACIKLHEGMVEMTVEYRKLTKVRHLKHSYKLWFGKRAGILLDPACFTKGTFEEFKHFLREVRPDLTIPE